MVAMRRDHGFVEIVKRGEVGLWCGASATGGNGQATVQPVTSGGKN